MAKAEMTLDAEARSKQLGHLWWLVDAPLFIDDPLIAKFYDAVVWPQAIKEAEIDKTKSETNFEGRGTAGIEGQVVPTFLSGLFGNLKAKGELSASAKAASAAEREVRQVIVMNSERRLHALTATYLETFPERVLHLTLPRGVFSNYTGDLTDDEVESLLSEAPRPLVFIDVEKSVPMLPTVAELESGALKFIYSNLEKSFLRHLKKPRGYPTATERDRDRKKKAYWKALTGNFDAREAMIALEDACAGSKIGWLDFRVPLNPDGKTMHMHFVPGGRYYTGVFGYYVIRRSSQFGIRVVATLKSGLDVNVLATFER